MQAESWGSTPLHDVRTLLSLLKVCVLLLNVRYEGAISLIACLLQMVLYGPELHVVNNHVLELPKRAYVPD